MATVGFGSVGGRVSGPLEIPTDRSPDRQLPGGFLRLIWNTEIAVRTKRYSAQVIPLQQF
jgi:hypothetical protein